MSLPHQDASFIARNLGRQDYVDTWQAMRDFTNTRDSVTKDEVWVVEHPPVFTQGQAGKASHILSTSDIPLVQSDRGGQVTYHGPGQLIVYPLLDLKRLKLGVRELVTRIELSVVDLLARFSVTAAPRPDAPGVYVDAMKIASLGLRVRRGCSYHGVAINLNTDLRPFSQINPCGYEGLQMVNLQDLVDGELVRDEVISLYLEALAARLEISCLKQF